MDLPGDPTHKKARMVKVSAPFKETSSVPLKEAGRIPFKPDVPSVVLRREDHLTTTECQP